MTHHSPMSAQKTSQNIHVPDLSGTCAAFCAGFFAKKPKEINDVPDVPGSKATPFACVRAHAHAKNTAQILPPHGYIPRHIRHIRHIVDFYRKNGKKGGTVSGTTQTNPAHAGPAAQAATTRVIRCTPENAKQVQQLVKADPQLHALVQSLQAQGLFPGLRAITFTLTGTPDHCAKGLQAIAESAAQPKNDAAPC